MRPDELMSNKDYKLQQLEKIVDDRKFYLSKPEYTKRFIDESSLILNELKGHDLNKDEKKKVSKIASWINKLRLERFAR